MHAKHLYVLTGASRGMGLAMAEQLLAPGHHVVCLSRQRHAALQTLADEHGATLEQWRVDLAKPVPAAAQLGNWLAQHDAAQWASATLINNAGVIPTVTALSQCPAPEVSQALRVGLEAPMLLMQAFLGSTLAWVQAGWRGPRKVLNISSGLGRRAMAAQAPYCAAKAGMDHMSRCVALDEAQHPHGAKVVSLAPGVIDTDMQVQLRGASATHFPDHERFVELHTQGYLTSPSEAAKRVLAYLAQPSFGDTPVDDVRG
jgi:benzil reductase ((S)-benzoin forming)